VVNCIINADDAETAETRNFVATIHTH